MEEDEDETGVGENGGLHGWRVVAGVGMIRLLCVRWGGRKMMVPVPLRWYYVS